MSLIQILLMEVKSHIQKFVGCYSIINVLDVTQTSQTYYRSRKLNPELDKMMPEMMKERNPD